MKSLLRKARNRLLADLPRKRDLDRHYEQIAGLFQIQNAIQGLPVLRPMREWAISPDAMAWVLADLQERDAPTVIEFGSGQSTVILAAALRHRGGKLISVEHDPEYSAIIQRQVAACGLNYIVEYVHSDLIPGILSPSDTSYDVTVVPESSVDIALIDGPPYFNGPLTRLTPLRWSAEHLAKGGAIFLDDTMRPSEQACLVQLQKEYTQLQRLDREAEKGLVELRFD